MWGRILEVTIGSMTLSYPELTIEVTQKFDLDTVPLVTEITLFNLSNNTIAAIMQENSITVNAGYSDEGIHCISKGDLRQAFTEFVNRDKVTTLRSVNTNPELNSIFMRTYSKGTPIADVLNDLLAGSGTTLSRVNVPGVLDKALTVKGKKITIIKDLCKEHDVTLTIDNAGMALIDKPIGEDTGYLLKANTGLIGSPVPYIDEEGNVKYELNALFLPGVKALSKLRVESKTLTGNVQVISGGHTLTKDGWTTKLEVETLA
ncbi:MAG: phage protein [Cellulosilyticaceae bacterium]